MAQISTGQSHLRKKLFPTTTPTTVPMIAPATKSESQWMVIETPMPT
jgi:hypothetical protein